MMTEKEEIKNQIAFIVKQIDKLPLNEQGELYQEFFQKVQHKMSAKMDNVPYLEKVVQ